MSKALFRFIIVACVVLACVVSPAQVTTKPTTPQVKQIPMGARVLPKNEAQKKEFAQWQQLYGYGQDSHTYYNLAVLIAGTDQHGKIINRNISYINMILAADDPNSLASMVVKNHNAINSLAKENIELKKRLGELEATQTIDPNVYAPLMRGVLYRLDALEEKNKINVLVSGLSVNSPEPLPYIYDDPNFEVEPGIVSFLTSTVCTKHGRLSAEQPMSFADRRYCCFCVYEVAAQYLDRYIGMDPNEI